jgi:cytidine deaminase
MPHELEALQLTLIRAAVVARLHAYAPYSRFAVGAAVLDEAGRIHSSCNVENAAYPQGQCAEAGAIAAMVLAGGRRIQAVAVCAEPAEGQGAVSPCGGCRQRLREFSGEEVPVWLCNAEGAVLARYTLGELLPHSFGPAQLGMNR